MRHCLPLHEIYHRVKVNFEIFQSKKDTESMKSLSDKDMQTKAKNLLKEISLSSFYQILQMKKHLLKIKGCIH